MTKTKEASESLKKVFEELAAQFNKQQKELKKLTDEQAGLLKRLKDILNALKALQAEDSTIDLSDLKMPDKLKFNISESTTIGDAIEAVLKESLTLPFKDLISKLRDSGVRISENNARVVVYNAITRDSKKRFKITKDKEVILNK